MMTLEDIKSLKDKVYELEGLLELAQLREEKIPELEPLIRSRIGMLLEKDDVILESENVSVTETDVAEIEEENIIVTVTDNKPAATVTIKTSEEKHTVEKQKNEKPAFCLNDRFRFRRELFSNSDAEFSAAMNTIAAMESYEEAEEYFLGQLGWDAENPEVADFMEIIRGYFGA